MNSWIPVCTGMTEDKNPPDPLYQRGKLKKDFSVASLFRNDIRGKKEKTGFPIGVGNDRR
jgi:hypothetical protein